jgi:hypothetical protein
MREVVVSSLVNRVVSCINSAPWCLGRALSQCCEAQKASPAFGIFGAEIFLAHTNKRSWGGACPSPRGEWPGGRRREFPRPKLAERIEIAAQKFCSAEFQKMLVGRSREASEYGTAFHGDTEGQSTADQWTLLTGTILVCADNWCCHRRTGAPSRAAKNRSEEHWAWSPVSGASKPTRR